MEQLVVSLLGSDKTGMAHEICKLASHCNCHLIDSHITVLGNEFLANLLLAGTWNALAKFEASLPAFEQKHEIRSLTRRTHPQTPHPNCLPYNIYVTAIEKADVIFKVTKFFSDQNVHINEIFIDTYIAPYSDVQMMTITLSVGISSNNSLADFRDNLMVFGDEKNFDIALEPQKN